MPPGNRFDFALAFLHFLSILALRSGGLVDSKAALLKL